MKIGAMVRRERRRLEISQTELARRLGELGWFADREPYHQAVGKLERDEQQVTLEQWLMLAQALGTAPLRLLMPDGSITVPGIGTVSRSELYAWLHGDEPLVEGSRLPYSGDLRFYEELTGMFDEVRSQVRTLNSRRRMAETDPEVFGPDVAERERSLQNTLQQLLDWLEAYRRLVDDVDSMIPLDLSELVTEAKAERKRRERLRWLMDDDTGPWPKEADVGHGLMLKRGPGQPLERKDQR